VFERYRERARRAVFFARYEACQLGSPTIECEHLLLGIMREDPALFFKTDGTPRPSDLKKAISANLKVAPPIGTSVDIPLSADCKRAIAQAAEEADRLGSRTVGCEHILIGLMRQEESHTARAMKEAGMKLSALRTAAARSGGVVGSDTEALGTAVGQIFKVMEFMWNEQNLDGFAGLFSAVADFVDVTGSRLTDRSQIAEATHAFDRLGNDLSTIKLTSHSILLSSERFCVSRVIWDIEVRESGRRVGSVMMTAALENMADSWKIVMAQNTRVEN
jgi:Clp amino terminal domain, pathogenicity island component